MENTTADMDLDNRLFAPLMRGEIQQILTPNIAMARELRRRYLQSPTVEIHNGGTPTPAIQDIDGFLRRQAQQQAQLNGCVVASELQQRLLWETIIGQHTQTHPNLDAAQLAQQALQGWRLLHEYQVDFDKLDALERFNELRFGDWCRGFERALQHANWVTTETFSIADASAPATLICIGFDAPFSPRVDTLLSRLFQQRKHLPWPEQHAATYQCATPSAEAQLDAAGRWAKQVLERTPNARIAIIDIEWNTAPQVKARCLQRALGETKLTVAVPQNISRLPALQALFDLSAILKPECPLSDWRALVHNPYLGNYPHDHEIRAQLETQLCLLQQKYLSQSDALNCVEQVINQTANHPLDTELAQQFGSLLRRAQQQRYNQLQRPLMAWFEEFDALLASFQWASRLAPDALDTLHDHWQKLGQGLLAIAAQQNEISLQRALTLIQNQAQLLSVATPTSTSGVSVIGTLEGAVGYSHIWLLHADNQHWPGRVQLNPLVPVPIQIEHQFPRCQNDLELAFCERLLTRLAQRCEMLVFSLDRNNSGEENTEFSALLPSCRELELTTTAHAAARNHPRQHAPGQIELVATDQAPALAKTDYQVSGGSRLFDLMLTSPFDAFVEFRLRARPLETGQIGLSTRQRGTLIHSTLYTLWQELNDQPSLLKQDNNRLRTLCERALRRALADLQRRGRSLSAPYQASLISTYTELLSVWLNAEKQRPPFAVHDKELRLQLNIAPLSVSLQADRVDQLDDGYRLLIDYKTGRSANIGDYYKDDFTKSQLALYALATGDADGVALGKVTFERPELSGVSRIAMGSGFKVLKDWAQQLETWRAKLQQAAQDYADGVSHVQAHKPYGNNAIDPLDSLRRSAERELIESLLNTGTQYGDNGQHE